MAYLLLILLLLVPSLSFAAVDATNSGFLLSVPADNPSGTQLLGSNRCRASKFTSPSNASKVVALFFWLDATGGATIDFQIGLYTHDAGNDRPSSLVGSANNVASVSTTGWKSVTGLDISISPSTVYWVGVSMSDEEPANPAYDYSTVAGGRRSIITSTPTLPATWSGSTEAADTNIAFGAVYETSDGIQRVIFF